jgi:hypothetical protein
MWLRDEKHLLWAAGVNFGVECIVIAGKDIGLLGPISVIGIDQNIL